MLLNGYDENGGSQHPFCIIFRHNWINNV